ESRVAVICARIVLGQPPFETNYCHADIIAAVSAKQDVEVSAHSARASFETRPGFAVTLLRMTGFCRWHQRKFVILRCFAKRSLEGRKAGIQPDPTLCHLHELFAGCAARAAATALDSLAALPAQVTGHGRRLRLADCPLRSE